MAKVSTLTPRLRPLTTVAALIDGSGKSLSQIARETGCSLSNISRVRSGHRSVSVSYASRLAPALGIDTLTLIAAMVADTTRKQAA